VGLVAHAGPLCTQHRTNRQDGLRRCGSSLSFENALRNTNLPLIDQTVFTLSPPARPSQKLIVWFIKRAISLMTGVCVAPFRVPPMFPGMGRFCQRPYPVTGAAIPFSFALSLSRGV
jgi:hypothetical protein